jgi:acetylornithine deacetylase/succinyl-diaminopimelate desuccinylase family protein
MHIKKVPDPARLRARLAALVGFRTENPPGDEAAVARWLGEELARVGCTVEHQEVAPGRLNLVAMLANGPGPCLAFCSHLDVIPAGEGWTGDPFVLREEEGRLVGRGACDAKGSVAAMVEAMRLLAGQPREWRGRLVGVFVADEEVGSTGGKRFAADHPGVDRIVVGEPTDLVTVSAHKGCLRPRIRVAGRMAHSGRPDLGDNAVVKASRLVARFALEDARLRQLMHPLVGPASLTVTRIQGGLADNIVPPACEITLDRRMLPGESAETVEPEIRAILKAAEREEGILTEILGFSSTAGPSETPPDDPIVRAAVAACVANRVEPPGPVGFLGGCDLVHFQRVGIRGVVLGPGSLAQAHRPDEWVRADDLARASLIYRDLALTWFREVGA